MKATLVQTASVAIIVFGVSSMISVGLAYSFGQIIGPLRGVRAVFRALLANFVLVPLLAIALERMIPMEPSQALGLFLLAGSAGAPFLIKLTSTAKSDLALSAALLVLLVPATVVFLPFYVPFAMQHPSLRGLSYVPAGDFTLGLPLLTTLFLPILLGLTLKELAPRWAAWLLPIGGKLATVALVTTIVSTFVAHTPELIAILQTGAIVAGVMLVVGAFIVGYLLSRSERSAVLGLGTAQRNIAAAMVIASRDFVDPDILVMITACVLTGLLVLFPIAWILGRQRPRVGVPTSDAALT